LNSLIQIFAVGLILPETPTEVGVEFAYELENLVILGKSLYIKSSFSYARRFTLEHVTSLRIIFETLHQGNTAT